MPRGDGKGLGQPRPFRKRGAKVDPPIQSKRLRRRLHDERPGEINWSRVSGKYVDKDGYRYHKPGSQKRS